MKNRRNSAMYVIGGFLILVFIIPNTTNFKERQAFSDEKRLKEAIQYYSVALVADSITVAPGEYYDRSKIGKIFLGEKQRELWKIPVQVKVFDYEEEKGGLKPYEFGGGQQTISMRLEDAEGRKWVLRSVNKDQKEALPKILQATFLRFLLRDQVAAMNPYGFLVTPVLAEAVEIHHSNPELVFVPYYKNYGEYNEKMAGRMAYLIEHLNSSWKGRERYGSPNDIVNTEEMLEMQEEEVIPVDTLLYLKTRLFDMLINDWDRHPGQWEWALSKEGDSKIFEPIPKDRDMSFYIFDEGLFSKVLLLFNKKFQSFRKSYGKVSGLMQQSEEQDKRILSTLSVKDFISAARKIQMQLTPEVIHQAFKQYPPNIYEVVGKEHEEILHVRLSKLHDIAEEFHALVQK